MYICHECGWTGNKTELDEGVCCPECGSVSASPADSLDFVPGELDITSTFPDDIEEGEVEDGSPIEDTDTID